MLPKKCDAYHVMKIDCLKHSQNPAIWYSESYISIPYKILYLVSL